jgi:hypothetical protein
MSYEAWRISFQSSEAAAKAAYAEWQRSVVMAADIAVKHAYDDQAASEAKEAILNLLGHSGQGIAK